MDEYLVIDCDPYSVTYKKFFDYEKYIGKFITGPHQYFVWIDDKYVPLNKELIKEENISDIYIIDDENCRELIPQDVKILINNWDFDTNKFILPNELRILIQLLNGNYALINNRKKYSMRFPSKLRYLCLSKNFDQSRFKEGARFEEGDDLKIDYNKYNSGTTFPWCCSLITF
jgi:hypothetical protein